MPKTAFTKSELTNIHFALCKEKVLPCEDIVSFYDTFNSGYESNYYIFKFVKGKKQVSIGVITRTQAKHELMLKQLKEYFMENHDG